MNSVFVFSGTSEGREVCEKLADRGVKCQVFVATDYGEAVMKEHENIHVNVGRLDKDEIVDRIKNDKPEYVIDATHPHAIIISENIKKACEELGIDDKYIRVLRQINSISGGESDFIISVSSNEEAVEILKTIPSGKIMLTTGVKELKYYCIPELIERLIARILPGKESLNIAYDNGLSSKAIIAIEGPFSESMNRALIDEYGVSVLVTKNSGSRGGFLEKINACRECNIKALVIDNPDREENGISVDSAVGFILDYMGTAIDASELCDTDSNNRESKNAVKSNKKRKVTLVGVGVCKEEYLLPKGRDAIEKAQVIIGARRMIEFGKMVNSHAKIIQEYEAKKVTDIVKNLQKENIVILLSGDTGLCSGAKSIIEKLYGELGEEIDLSLVPGISSISYFASKIKLQYSDYPFVSLHNSHSDYLEYIRNGKGFFAICSGVEDVKKIAHSIISGKSEMTYENNKEYSLITGKDLGSADEEITEIKDINQINEMTEGLYVIAVILK